MKYSYGILGIIFILISCKEIPQETPPAIQVDILEAIVGEYDNFQQCWQENTQEGIHKVEIQEKHKHIHTVIRKTETPDWLYIRHSEGRDSSKVMQESGWHISRLDRQWEVKEYDWSDELTSLSELPKPQRQFQWNQSGAGFTSNIGEELWEIRGDTLFVQDAQENLFSNKEPYRLLRCRFFSGWIEYPLPAIPDSMYRMGNLRIHDQGGIVQLVLGDGIKNDYSVELTQLVYGRQLSIMKLAIYQEPFEDIHYNSRSISYTWTTPIAKRIGINLRKVSSGWTFIEPGFVSSNNMKK